MTRTILVAQSIEYVDMVIRESAKTSEKLVDLKGRLMKRNAVENLRFDDLKNGRSVVKKQ